MVTYCFRIAVGALVCVLLVGCWSQHCWESVPSAPVTIGYVDGYEDGGTTVVVFTDGRECRYEICLDGREGPIDRERCLYINARYPTREGARRLDPESELGAGIHRALEEWYEAQFSAEERARLEETKTVMGLGDAETRGIRVLAVLRGFRRGACSKQDASD
jgi:hypothetical protein